MFGQFINKYLHQLKFFSTNKLADLVTILSEMKFKIK